MSLSRDEIRLECLKAAISRSPDHNEALLRAEDFFKFVKKDDAPTEIKGSEKAPKQTGNATNS